MATLEFDLGGIAQISKISYEFVTDSDTIGSEVVPEGTGFSVTLPALVGKTCQTSIVVWTQSGKIYRYKNNVTFDGEAKTLPPPSLAATRPAGGWEPFFHKKAGSADIFFSADPRASYTVEIHLPKGSYVYEAFVDREFDKIVGTQPILDQYEFFEQPEGPSDTIVVPFLDPVGFDAARYRVTSVVILQFGPVGGGAEDAETFGDLLSWTLENGVLVP